MKYLVIFLVLIGFVGTIFAIPPFDSQEIFDFSNTIVVGKIISVNSTFSPTHNLYHIQVEKFLKNPRDSQIIIATGQNAVFSRLGNEVFHVGDRALFFLTSNYVGYDTYSDILSIHPTTRSVEPEWDACDIFANDVPQEHWVFGGVGTSVKAFQENKTRDFVTGKEILITRDISNPTPVEKKIDFGMTIKNIDDPNSLYIFSEISNIVLEPCVPYHTLTWTFTPSKAGNYRFEFDNLMGSRHTLGMEIKQDVLSKNYSSVLSPLKQFRSGVVVNEIQCKQNLILIQKYDGTPACVSSKSAQTLYERGWTPTLHVLVNREAPTVHLESTPLDIANIEGRYIHLNPVDTCATVSLRLLSPDDLKQTKSGTKDVVFFELDDQSMDEFPVLGELIRATHYLDFPSNEHARTEIGLKELVDYEFFIMEKAIDKYNDTQDDYFMKLDGNLDEKLANPKKQGFSNEFIAPQIVYRDKTYTMDSTVFWVADEHEMQSISIRLQDNLKEDAKYITLTDKDMDSVPKIKQTIEKIGTELESIVAFKGMPENPDWNNYREWFDQKKTEQFNLSDVYVKGFVYEGEYYDLGFLIC